MYISEIIGEQYTEWGNGPESRPFMNKKVFITAPTGTGKTTFILEKLLLYAYEHNVRIGYFVNRVVLKRQIEEKINELAAEITRSGKRDIKNHIDVWTYQQLEQQWKSTGNNPLEWKRYGYIVCDEAHYFLSDSMFNTNTWISYCMIAEMYGTCPVIFMSATLRKLKEILPEIEVCRKAQCFGTVSNNNEGSHENAEKEYVCKSDYSYLDIKIFDEIKNIPDIIRNEARNQKIKNNKWLIFYNDIIRGKELVKKLKEVKLDAVFVDSNFEEEKEAAEIVSGITQNRIVKSDIVVTTSVLDNGVSIEDEDLRNIIILAENEIEFIQMLGRKRQDGKKVKLYLCKRSRQEFSNRLHYVNKLWNAYQDSRFFLDRRDSIGLLERLFNNPGFYSCARNFLFQWKSSIWTYKVPTEKKGEYREIVCNTPEIYSNRFSEIMIAEQKVFLKEQVEKFEKNGEYAFIDTQCGWLGISKESISELREQSIDDEIEKNKDTIQSILQEFINQELSAEQNRNLKKEKLREPLRKLIKLAEEQEEREENLDELHKLDDDVRKPERPLSYPKFNRCMELFDLPYRMDEKEGEPYVIRKIGDTVDIDEI